MKLANLEHVLRAAVNICGETEYIIVGSQSIHGKYPDLADEILVSIEVDIIAKRHPKKTELLNAIGVMSPFHDMYGYYADPVDYQTSILPSQWKNRLVHLKTHTDVNGAKAYCLDPHDLVIAKLFAGRDKDKVFIEALLERKLIDPNLLKIRLNDVKHRPDHEMQYVLKRIEYYRHAQSPFDSKATSYDTTLDVKS